MRDLTLSFLPSSLKTLLKTFFKTFFKTLLKAFLFKLLSNSHQLVLIQWHFPRQITYESFSVLRAQRSRSGGVHPHEGSIRVISQVRGQPAFDFADRHAFAFGVVFNLVTLQLSHGEIFTVRVAENPARDRRTWPHGE